jgi:hypothetical protein
MPDTAVHATSDLQRSTSSNISATLSSSTTRTTLTRKTDKPTITADPTASRNQPLVSVYRNVLPSQGRGRDIVTSYPRWWVIIQDGGQSCADVAEVLSERWAILVTGVHKTAYIP